MKTIKFLVASFLTIILLNSCNSGPDEIFVKECISQYLIKHAGGCAWGSNTRTINDIKIVSKKSHDGIVTYQAISNVTTNGRCDSAGTYDLQISADFEKFGDEWKLKDHGLKYQRK
jgi:hypothetical protein